MSEDTTGSHMTTRDPVCGMHVDPDAGKPRLDRDGVTYHFCCEGCRGKFATEPEAWIIAVDPVCGMDVDRATARYMSKHSGERFFFCAERCQEKFEREPDAYLGDRVLPPPAPPGTTYICPMCPEVESDHPDDCPVCGMALEPAMPSLDDGPNPELVDFRRRLMLGAPLALAVLILEMGGMLGLAWDSWLGSGTVRWLQFLLATPVVIWIARPFFARGWSSIVTGNLNMWTLIAIGTGAAYAFSLVSLIAPGIFPAELRGSHGPPLYFEAAAVILVLVLLGQVMELTAREPTRGIDIGARHEIYRLIAEFASHGSGVLLISSELEELMGLCDRILVMREGEIALVRTRDRFDREELILAALGGGAGS